MNGQVPLSQLIDEAEAFTSEMLEWSEVQIASGRPILPAQFEAWEMWGDRVISLSRQIEELGGEGPPLFDAILDWGVLQGVVCGSEVARGIDWAVFGGLALLGVLVRLENG